MRLISFTLIGISLMLMACSDGSKSDVANNFELVKNDMVMAVDDHIMSEEMVTPLTTDKIIKNGHIEIEVTDFVAAKHSVDSIVKAHNAYILREEFNQRTNFYSTSLEIKVPAEEFDQLLSGLAKVATKVNYQSVNSHDVTEEYIDINAQVTNKKKVERTYLNLLNKASSVEDILKIEAELGKIRGEIESIQGRIKYIDSQVKSSNISIEIIKLIDPKLLDKDKPSFWNQIGHALKQGYRGFIWFVLFILRTWPIWLITTLIVFFIQRRRKRQRIILQNEQQIRIEEETLKMEEKKEGKRKKAKKKDIFKDFTAPESEPQPF